MAFYEEINPIILTATSMLLQNKNICKLLYYYPEKKDLKYNPLAQSDVPNPSELLMNGIYPLPKNPNLELNQRCSICVGVSGSNFSATSKNQGFEDIYLIFDVQCHIDAWMIKNGLRPVSVIQEIDRMFNGQQTNLPVINKPFRYPFKEKEYSPKYFGFQLAYKLTISSNVGC